MNFAARTEPEFTFMLPGNWWRVSLTDEESRQADIRSIARDAFGKADNVARLRADLRAELLRATELAVDGDADSMYFAREVIQGVPLPVSLVVTYTADYAGISPIQPERNLETLVNSVDRIDDDSHDEADDDYVLGESAVVRRIRFQEPKEIDDSEIAGRAPSLSVNYWITVPKRNRVLVMAFQTAFTELKEPLLDLYNAIVESIRWNVPDREPVADPDSDISAETSE